MDRQFYDTSDYLKPVESSIEVNIPMTLDDMRVVRDELLETHSTLTRHQTAPQQVDFATRGYTDNKGVQTFEANISRNHGINTRLSAQLRTGNDAFSFYLNPESGHTDKPFYARLTEDNVPKRGYELSPAEVMHQLARYIPESKEALMMFGNTIEPTLQSIDDLIRSISRELNMTETHTETYTLTEQALASPGIVFSERSIILQQILSDTGKSRVRLALISSPLSPETGVPIRDASYGYNFTFDYPSRSNTSTSYNFHGTATGFGRSRHPSYDTSQLHDLLVPKIAPSEASKSYRDLFIDAAKELSASQLPHIDFDLMPESP